MEKLDKWDNLLIRACKSNGDSVRRLCKIWKMRCCVAEGQNIYPYIADRLITIMENTQRGLDVRDIIDSLDPSSKWKNNIYEVDSYHLKVIKILITKIAFTAVDQWNGLISPAKFRKK